MSWFFGAKPVQQTPQIPQLGAAGAGGSDADTGTKANVDAAPRNTETQYRFDSAALERAAKAAKDLEKSGHAKELLELSRSQEKTKQMEIEKQIKEMQTYQEELKANASQKLMEEKRKLLNEETQHNNEVLY